MNDKQKAQLVNLVKMAMQGDQEAQQQIQQIMQFAQQGDPGAQQVAGLIQQIIQELQGQTPAKRQGGILDYLKYLRGQCPEGYEMQYFKSGGKTIQAGCKKCQQASQGQKFKDEVEEFKCGRKMKKKAKDGAKVPEAKCGKKVVKKGEQGLNGVPYTRKKVDDYNYTDTKKDSKGRTSTRSVSEDGTLYTGRNGKSGMEGTLVGDSIKGKDWKRGELIRNKTPKKANGGTLTLDDIRTRLGGGQFVPFLKKGLN